MTGRHFPPTSTAHRLDSARRDASGLELERPRNLGDETLHRLLPRRLLLSFFQMIVVLMGVSGTGKTTVGRVLAHDLSWRFFDADDFHSAANIARMRAGVPLTDEDREPWLDSLRELVRRADAAGEGIVLACSALRRRFRDRLRAPAHDLRYVFLRATPELIAGRMSARTGHFMPAALLGSQFEALEEPDDALTLDASRSPDELVLRIRRALAL